MVFPQADETQLFNNIFYAWNHSTYNNEPTGGWLQPIVEESAADLNAMNNEDALSFYGLEHPTETAVNFNAPTVISPITPPASVNEDDDDDSVIYVTYDFLVSVARGPPPEDPKFDSWNNIFVDIDSNSNFIDNNSINNTILDNYSSRSLFASYYPIFDNSTLNSFLRIFTKAFANNAETSNRRLLILPLQDPLVVKLPHSIIFTVILQP
ncbi:hypothetical protein BD408DRAFT_78447 [Parasitella parasitica]|nr:hypothetical protein BD408DRAFT_78447 [Parasitella parasitica]